MTPDWPISGRNGYYSIQKKPFLLFEWVKTNSVPHQNVKHLDLEIELELNSNMPKSILWLFKVEIINDERVTFWTHSDDLSKKPTGRCGWCPPRRDRPVHRVLWGYPKLPRRSFVYICKIAASHRDGLVASELDPEQQSENRQSCGISACSIRKWSSLFPWLWFAEQR